MIRLAVGMVLPIAATLIVLRRTPARDSGPLFCACAACGLGLGLSSLSWWLLMQLPIRSATPLVLLDLTAWTVISLGLAALLPASPRTDRVEHSGQDDRLSRLSASTVLIMVCVPAVVTFAAMSIVSPHGNWDAWAIWNAKARFLFLGFPGSWREAFIPATAGQPDYPLLLPISIARAWTLAGRESVGIPIALAAIFAVSIVVIAGTSIRRNSTTSRGLLTSAFLVASPAFVLWAPSQFADVPLGFYLLLTFVLATAATKGNHALWLWALAGLSAGLAAWTKNEGAVFALAAIVVWAGSAAMGRISWGSLAAFVAGAAPVLLILIVFKLRMAPPNDIASAQSSAHVLAVLNERRLSLIVRTILQELWYGGATTIGTLPLLALYVLSSGIRNRYATMTASTFLTLGLMLCAYTAAYVLTPHDLEWHLKSIHRVMLHLLPSIVWAGMLLIA